MEISKVVKALTDLFVSGGKPQQEGKREFFQAAKSADFIAIDFETAHLSRNSACQVGVAVARNGKIIATRSSLIRPPIMAFYPKFVAIHGITPSDVKTAPTFRDVWFDWLGKVIPNKMLVAHNANFDMQVLEASAEEYGIKLPRHKVFCTLDASRNFYDVPNHRLGTMARYLGLNINHHDAEADAVTCAELAIAIWNKKHIRQIKPLELTPQAIAFCVKKTFVFTGEPCCFDREDVENLLQNSGAYVRKTISGKTDFIIVGQKLWGAYKRVGFSTTKLLDAITRAGEGGKLKLIGESLFASRVLNSQDVPTTRPEPVPVPIPVPPAGVYVQSMDSPKLASEIKANAARVAGKKR